MPGCVLRASGDGFKVDEFMLGTTLIPCNIFHKGEERSKRSTWNATGMTVSISDEGDNLERQVNDAIAFLTMHREELVRLRGFSGLEFLGLDFGVNRKDVFVQSCLFPAEFVALAGEIGLDIELSMYSSAEET